MWSAVATVWMHPKRSIRCVGRAARKQDALNDACTQCYTQLVDRGLVDAVETIEKVLLIFCGFCAEC